MEESPDASPYEVCYSWPTCSKVSVGVNANNGLLFLSSDGPLKNDYYVNDFPSQRVELSLQEADGARKVYREVMVHRSQRVADCSDYPYQDKTRYTCLFLKEQVPPVPLSTTASMREALPQDLAQPERELFSDVCRGIQRHGCGALVGTLPQSGWTHSIRTT